MKRQAATQTSIATELECGHKRCRTELSSSPEREVKPDRPVCRVVPMRRAGVRAINGPSSSSNATPNQSALNEQISDEPPSIQQSTVSMLNRFLHQIRPIPIRTRDVGVSVDPEAEIICLQHPQSPAMPFSVQAVSIKNHGEIFIQRCRPLVTACLTEEIFYVNTVYSTIFSCVDFFNKYIDFVEDVGNVLAAQVFNKLQPQYSTGADGAQVILINSFDQLDAQNKRKDNKKVKQRYVTFNSCSKMHHHNSNSTTSKRHSRKNIGPKPSSTHNNERGSNPSGVSSNRTTTTTTMAIPKHPPISNEFMDEFELIQLNVGGQSYTTTLGVLTYVDGSKLQHWFSTTGDEAPDLPVDSEGRYFVDRDGELFRYVLDVIRQHKDSMYPGSTAVLPQNFNDTARLVRELEFYGLDCLIQSIGGSNFRSQPRRKSTWKNRARGVFDAVPEGDPTFGHGCITVGYHGTFSFSHPSNQQVGSEPNFRKIQRIILSGRVSLLREVFDDTLHEGRDPDRGMREDRYTSRFYLKHTYLEQAFDALHANAFRLAASSSTGTNAPSTSQLAEKGNVEEDRWMHYIEYVFMRP